MIRALLWAGILQSLRNRVTIVFAAFAVILLAASQIIVSVTSLTTFRAFIDFGLGTMAWVTCALALYLSIGTLHRDQDTRSIALVLSRPISRTTYLFARYLGVAATLLLLLAAMAALYLIQLLYFDIPVPRAVYQALCGTAIEVLLLAALGFFFASCVSSLTAFTSCIALYLIGHALSDVGLLTAKAPPLVRFAGKLLTWVVPNLERFDFKVAAAQDLAVNGAELFRALGYGVSWTLLFLFAGAILLSRRDLK